MKTIAITHQEEWYEHLVEECKAIITEAVFASRWALVEGYWTLGKRISEDNNFDRKEAYGKKIVQGLGESLSVSTSTIYYALQAYDKYPDIQKLPEGKNITWNKLITKYLPQPKKPKTIPLPKGVFDVIYADPPWFYSNSGFSMSAELQYPTIPTEEIIDYKDDSGKKIKDLPSENSILFMWTTNPLLKDAMQVIEGWGFNYKTNIVWVKENHTAGFYVFGKHELLLIATKGTDMLPADDGKIKSVIQGENKVHSKKPEIVYDLKEKMYPEHKYLELFARNKRKGWESWGNEI